MRHSRSWRNLLAAELKLGSRATRLSAFSAHAEGHTTWTFAGSQRGADRAAVMLTLITTARLKDIDPKAWLADAPARIAPARTAAVGMETSARSRKGCGSAGRLTL